MLLSRIEHNEKVRLKLDDALLPEDVTLASLLALSHTELLAKLESLPKEHASGGQLFCPAEAYHEVWASGVTYLRSRDARKLESQVADVYERVYDADRPELFFKALGWRSLGHGAEVRIRADSQWNVPEAEVCLVINSALEIVGYCAGNDMSSRDIEGENPLYLPQAKMYNGSCALGPGIQLIKPGQALELPITVRIERSRQEVFAEQTSTANMKRGFEELVSYLGREIAFPEGVFLMTGTGMVPPDDFTLATGDVIAIGVGELELVNTVAAQ